MDRYICIHGHFYQPPRENPWLEDVELQDSAYPYHDWNERITAECYGPNAAARILDGEGRIDRILNNYSRISFNVGPTLLAWMEEKTPDVYQAILDADAESQKRFSGHGSAIAQAYNHMILPLAHPRDKETQVVWGIRDFEHRFKRRPEGMWLAETAVDHESLSIMAKHGIRFTILAPSQAGRFRGIGESDWQDRGPGGIDPTTPYRVALPEGRSIVVFFYDGPISRAVAFEKLLSSGEYFAQRLLSGFNDQRPWPQIMHIATDGETYGHHHAHGDMALAYALEHIESNNLARITNYGEYLALHPPQYEAEVVDNTSWSCAHGIERWRNDCGCHTGGQPGWNQSWRAPLREALDWLRDSLTPFYEDKARQYLKDPWSARSDYIEVMLDRSPENVNAFIQRHANRELSAAETITVLKLMELQRHAMLTYTSCGWFFDELSGIEPVQVIQYAGRVVQLADELFNGSNGSRSERLPDDTRHQAPSRLESQFLERLRRAKSNLPDPGDGQRIYEQWVKPAMVGLEQVAAHYAVRSLFEPYPDHATVYGYSVDRQDYHHLESGRASFGLGYARFASKLTRESATLAFGAVHFGDHNLNAGVCQLTSERTFQEAVDELSGPFMQADFGEVIRGLDRRFGASSYSLRSLFRDEQRQILSRIVDTSMGEAEDGHRRTTEQHEPMMRFLASIGMPQPTALRTAAEFILNLDLRRSFEKQPIDPDQVRTLTARARDWQINLDQTALAFALGRALNRLADLLDAHPDDVSALEQLVNVIGLHDTLPFQIDVWKVQNVYYRIQRDYASQFHAQAANGDPSAQEWTTLFATLGDQIGIRRG